MCYVTVFIEKSYVLFEFLLNFKSINAFVIGVYLVFILIRIHDNVMS